MLQLSEGNLHADVLIDQTLDRNQIQGPDRGLLTELTLGVLRHQRSLDHQIQQLLDRPISQLDIKVLILLRMGIYQLQQLDRIPDHAAVHETVELAKLLAPRAKGLVNAVLRNFLRCRDQLAWPDRTADPENWLATTYSLPDWLVKDWLNRFTLDVAEQLAKASNQPPLLTIRVNTLKTNPAYLLELFASKGIDAALCNYAPEGIRLLQRCQVTELPGFGEGLFFVQDEASQLVARLLEPLEGETLLDACAAPGGKATHLAQLMGDKGEIVATDLNPRRLRQIEDNIQRLGINCIKVEAGDLLAPDYQQGRQFDRILLDAPCSGLGIIRRHPEAKWRIDPGEVRRCAERQKLLLAAAARLLKPGGLLVYATCSTSIEENEAVIDDFLASEAGYVLDCKTIFSADLTTIDGFFRFWPHQHGTDGFFAARLHKLL